MVSGGFSRSRRSSAILRRAGHIGLLSGLLVLVASCGHLLYADGPYRGRVLDAETKQPIEGAAVMAVWWKRSPAPHPIISLYDAQETLTDANGNFTIPGIVGGSLNPLAKIREPLFTIFKPGYAAYGGWSIKPISLPDTVQLYEEEGRTVVALRRLATREERIRNLDRIYPDPHVPEAKYPNLIRLQTLEEANLGLRQRLPKREGQP